MKISTLIQNYLEPNERVLLTARQKPSLFRFLLYLFFGQFLVIGGAIMVIIMTQDSFSAFWQQLSDISTVLPYVLIVTLLLVTFFLTNTIVKHRFHKELRTIYAFTDKGLILMHEASKEYPTPAIARCNYENITSDNYEYFHQEKHIHFFDIKFDNPVFDRVKLYRFNLGNEAPKILEAMKIAAENKIEHSQEEEI